MKTRLITLLSITLLTANMSFAVGSFADSSEFTGEDFFTASQTLEEKTTKETNSTEIDMFNETESKEGSSIHSMPPLKRARIRIKNKLRQRELQKFDSEKAPVAPENSIYDVSTETSIYASQDLKENFDEDTVSDTLDMDGDTIQKNEKKHFWNRKTKANKQVVEEKKDSIVLDCQNVDYDTDSYCVVATGDVSVLFVEQGTTLKADKITYDRMNNTIKAEDNVRIIRGSKVVYGEYIFVDLNEENALIEKPIMQDAAISIRSEKGYVYGDKIVQENGSMNVDSSFPIHFRSMGRGPRLRQMIVPPEDDTKDPAENILKLKTTEMEISQKGDLEIISMKKPVFYKGSKKILKFPALKLYTNRNLDFGETNAFEIGSVRGLGMYAGPGFVLEIPGGSVLKAIPMLNYHSGFGFGGLGRYQSASNWTQFGYGTADDLFILKGKQELDDNLYIQYAINDYMREWFLGRRRPKYGASLVYEKAMSKSDFLIKGQQSRFKHRVDLGYYQDMMKDSKFEKIQTSGLGTTRARYMAEASQMFYNKRNIEKQTAFSIYMIGQFAASIYGTGDSQVIGRLGPMLHMQYKRWMQDIGYFQSVYEDNTPLPVFDAYRYGKSNVYLRETIRLNKYLALSWFGSLNLSGDSPNNRDMQESSFYITAGPEEYKFSIGYDVIRQRTHFLVEIMMDAKGSQLEYQKLVIKQDLNAKKKEDPKLEQDQNFQKATPVLKHAVVEDVKMVEDVI